METKQVKDDIRGNFEKILTGTKVKTKQHLWGLVKAVLLGGNAESDAPTKTERPWT